MRVSIEVPVFKGRFLRSCIDSVLAQTSEAWTLSLLWDGGDEESRRILERVAAEGHPRVRVYFAENRGIATARKFLTDHSDGEYILPLDDDDTLPDRAVERFLRTAAECPWASLIRARRDFIDTEGATVQQEQWFPFGPRHYCRGMVTDVFNQAQPYLIRRSAYDRTRGWTGFPDFLGAGEDCDIFLQLEEVAHFEFIDETLYHYRLHGDRASHALTVPAAFEMWRRLADAAIARMELPLRRVNDAPPFAYESLPRPAITLEDVDFVVRDGGGVAADSLRRSGVPECAIHEGGAAASDGWRMAGFRSTKRRLICFLDDEVQIQDRPALATLAQNLDDMGADVLAAHECLLLRREVILATGGFDERDVPPSLQVADLCLQARRRGFSCVGLPLEGAICRATNWTPAEADALRSKWRSYPALLAA